ncbi:V-type ATP synthase subunit F [Gallicola sp. Sow4_E12]|uniref:V-type ATP synthase subunit F n=1 Tax=Gallicola sp. Sow4_E12 TaxID=3438785 RepID=UPI003F934B14
MMYNVAVIGDKDSVLAFRALGIEVFTAYGAEETRATLDKIAKEGYGVIFITEQLANLIPETISRYNSVVIPAVILIPSNQGTLNIGMDNINKNVEKAVGSNILE